MTWGFEQNRQLYKTKGHGHLKFFSSFAATDFVKKEANQSIFHVSDTYTETQPKQND